MNPQDAMKLAIEEAKRGAGFVAPNPVVGCVILDAQMNLIGKGYHARVGEAHAEINALNSVKNPSALSGAHVFVTLEPCAHHGRTGPCAEKLASLPIASVTYGIVDPNPKVSGNGLKLLEASGKRVNCIPELKDDLEDLAEIFLTNQRKHRPFVAIKVGSSLDGQMALSSGESQWITSEQSREHVQYLRGVYDAVLIGSNTFLNDNPKLNSRHASFSEKSNRVIIVDSAGASLSKLAASSILETRKPNAVYVVTNPEVDFPSDLDVVNQLKMKDLSWKNILKELFTREITSIMVEGGATVFSGLLSEKLVDRAYVFVAPKILGSGVGWTKELKIPSLASAPQLERIKSQTFDRDILISGRLRF